MKIPACRCRTGSHHVFQVACEPRARVIFHNGDVDKSAAGKKCIRNLSFLQRLPPLDFHFCHFIFVADETDFRFHFPVKRAALPIPPSDVIEGNYLLCARIEAHLDDGKRNIGIRIRSLRAKMGKIRINEYSHGAASLNESPHAAQGFNRSDCVVEICVANDSAQLIVCAGLIFKETFRCRCRCDSSSSGSDATFHKRSAIDMVVHGRPFRIFLIRRNPFGVTLTLRIDSQER